MVDVSIIIVNYKNYEMTRAAINSVYEKSSGFSYEVIVVDNSEDSTEYDNLKTALGDKAVVINANANIGFGRANNLGASISNGKYLYFLNNDTLLMNNAIYELYVVMENNKDIGVAGSNLFTKDGKPNHSFIPFKKDYRGDKKINSLWFIFLSKIKKKRFDFNYTDKILPVRGYVCGASFFIEKKNFEIIGGFDKDIFMYAEESLLCYQIMNRLHLQVVNVPSSKIIHFEGANLETHVSQKRASSFVDGNIIFYEKVYGTDVCDKYLKMMVKKYHQINLVKKIIGNNNQNSFVYEQAYRDALKKRRGNK